MPATLLQPVQGALPLNPNESLGSAVAFYML